MSVVAGPSGLPAAAPRVPQRRLRQRGGDRVGAQAAARDLDEQNPRPPAARSASRRCDRYGMAATVVESDADHPAFGRTTPAVRQDPNGVCRGDELQGLTSSARSSG